MAGDDAARRANATWFLEKVKQWDGDRYKIAECINTGDYLSMLTLLDGEIRLGREIRDHFVVEAKRAGATWQEIGDALGVERQTIWRKYSRLV